jgi:2-phospho-L-lactate guanylyltransferase (CobY/MobA/RfbA family)
MMMITVEATLNNKAIRVKTNDLFLIGAADYREIFIPLSAIRSIVLEDEANGINILFIDGTKYTLNYMHFTSVGSKIVGTDINNNQELLEALILLAGY